MSLQRWRLFATGAFFFGYLLWQVLYPALSYVDPRFRWFAWNMYAGRTDVPRFTVVYEDGRTRALGPLTSRRASARVYSSSVHQTRFVPPHICARWSGVREVRLHYRISGREAVHPCRSTAR
jgi:hypothetical protein